LPAEDGDEEGDEDAAEVFSPPPGVPDDAEDPESFAAGEAGDDAASEDEPDDGVDVVEPAPLRLSVR
jgi:hypothetical protein